MACDINKNVLINKVKEVTKIIGKKNYSDASVQILKNNINVVFKKVSNNSEPYRASVTLKHMINGIYGNIITEAPISNNLSKNVSLNIPLNDKTIGIVSSSKSVNTPTEKVLKNIQKDLVSEAVQVQTEDAKRAGIKFTERYLFNEEKSTNIDVDDKEPSNIKENRLSTFVPVIENSEYSEELKNIIIKDKSEIVSDLLEKGSPLAKQLIKILKPSLSENLKIKRNPNVLSGTYNSNSNIIELNPNIEDLENTLLHELIHDATVSTIFLVKNTPEKTTNAQIKAVENLENLFKEFKEKLNQDRKEGKGINTQGESSLEEFVTNIFTDANLQNYLNNIDSKTSKKTFFKKIIEQILKLLNIRTESILGQSMIESLILIQNKTEKTVANDQEVFSELKDDKFMFYTEKVKYLTGEQHIAARNLLSVQKQFKSLNEKEYIHTNSNTRLDKASNVLKQLPGGPSNVPGYYGFNNKEYNEEEYLDNKEWGNQIDILLEEIVLGKSKSDAINEVKEYQKSLKKSSILDENALNQTYKELINFVSSEEAKGIVLFSQITLGNIEKKVAGTLDLVGITPEGDFIIYDLKTSIHPTVGSYTSVSKNEKEYSNWYGKTYSKTAGKKERHIGQLSIYKALGFANGLPVVDTKIIAIHLRSILGVTSPVLEKVHELIPNNNIIKNFAVDGERVSAYMENLEDDSLSSISTKIKIALQKKHDELVSKNKKSSAAFMKRLVEQIKSAEDLKVVETFINESYNTLLGNTPTFKGFITRYYDIVTQIENKKLKGLEALNALRSIKDIYDLYSPLLNDIEELYIENEELFKTLPKDENSSLDLLEKLNISIKGIKNTKNGLEKRTNNLIAEEISNIIGKDKTVLSSRIKEIETKYSQKIKEKQKVIDDLKEKQKGKSPDSEEYIKLQKSINFNNKKINEHRTIISEYQSKYNIDKATILFQLEKGAHKDISGAEFFMSPSIMSSNNILASVTYKIKESFEKNRYELIKRLNVAEKAFKEYNEGTDTLRDNPAKFNEGIFQILSIPTSEGIVEKYSFISETDYAKYEKKRLEMLEEARKIKSLTEAKKFRKSWYEKNTERVPKEDIYLENPYDKDSKVVIQKGEKTILEELKQELSASEYEDILEMIKEGKIPSQLSIPKKIIYDNSKYKTLTSNPVKLKYHNYLLFEFLKAQELLPPLRKNHEKYIIPSVLKSSKERLIKSPLNYAKYQVDKFKNREEDIEEYGTEDNLIPVLYRYDLSLGDTSLDLMQSVMKFTEGALEFKSRNELLPFLTSVQESLEKNPPTKTENNKILISNAAKKLKIFNYNSYVKKHNGNNIAAMMEAIVDMHIYGKHRKKETIGNIDIGKWGDALMSFASFTQIGGNPMLAVANSLMSEAQILIESAAGKYFSPSILAKATLEYDKNLPNMIQDFNSPINKSKLGQLIELYDPIKGNFLDEYGRKISSTGFNRLLSTNSWFWMMRQGDHHAQVRMMIAALMNKKVKDSSGKEVSLYDAYKLNEETGELKLEVGFENLQIVDEQIKNQLHSINKSMHGVYNSFDRSVMSRYAIGRQIEMYRKFVYTGFMRRWKKNSYDVELGDITEGTYRTFLRVVFKDFNEVAKVLNPLNKESVNLTSLEKENLTRALVEFMFIFLTGLIVMLAEAKDDDEDELLAYTQYFALRLNMELGFFMGIGDPRSFVVLPNPMDAFRMFKTPLITTGVITKFLRLIHQLTGDPTERYTRDAGIAKEGDLKLKIYLWKLLGFNGHTSNPEEALKILQLQLQ